MAKPQNQMRHAGSKCSGSALVTPGERFETRDRGATFCRNGHRERRQAMATPVPARVALQPDDMLPAEVSPQPSCAPACTAARQDRSVAMDFRTSSFVIWNRSV